MKKRPNIIFIMTDQQRYDTMGCVNSKIITPNLDKLAAHRMDLNMVTVQIHPVCHLVQLS